MKDLNTEETSTYNALLHNIKVAANNSHAYHIARLKEFVEIMLTIHCDCKKEETTNEK